MPRQSDVPVAYDAVGDYVEVGRRLGIPPRQADLVATGLPADGGDSFPTSELRVRPGCVEGSTQCLVYPTAEPENSTTKPQVEAWNKRLIEPDQAMQHTDSARDAAPGEVLQDEETDIATVLSRDHDQVMALMKQLKIIPGASDGADEVHQFRRTSIVDMVAVVLSEREATEQEHFWPVRDAVGDRPDKRRGQGAQDIEQQKEGR